MNGYGFVKVAALSPRVYLADPARNAAQAAAAVLAAEQEQVQIAVFPELYLSGYSCGDLFLQDTLLDACEAALMALLKETASTDMLLAIGLPLRVQGRLFSCAAIVQHGTLLGLVPKLHIPDHREFQEKRWFASGTAVGNCEVFFCGRTVPFGRLMIDAGEACVAVELCEDLWMPISPSTADALAGAEIVLNLSASSEMVAKDAFRQTLIRQQSAKNICGYVYASAGVGESTTDLVFSGACTIAENGQTLAEGERFRLDGSRVCGCLDVERLRAERHSSSFYDTVDVPQVERIHISATLPQLSQKYLNRSFAPDPFVPQDVSQRAIHCKEALQIQAHALLRRIQHTGMETCVLGLSGGLDSTLALLVCKTAMELGGYPAENIHCITMPGFGTTQATKSNAVRLAECLHVRLDTIDITKACIQHMQDIGHDMNVHDATYENVQARERTQILMDLANRENALVIGTGDLSELALGWCTYNGDHMSMYSVNAGIPKTFVQHIVADYAAAADDATKAVLQDILDTPVSPELLPPDTDGNMTQKTEDVIGPYAVHDFYLYYFLRFGFRPRKLLFMACRAFADVYTEVQLRQWLELLLRRFFSQQFKRSCMPDGPKVGSVGLSPRGDWRMPSDAQVRAWLAELEAE